MNRSVAKENFLKYLHNHPAAVKKLVNPTDDLLIECLASNREVMDFLPTGRQNEKVIIGFLTAHPYSNYAKKYLEGNKDLASKLPMETVEKFLKNSGTSIIYFPQATQAMWLNVAREGDIGDIKYKDIPESYVSEKLLTDIIKQCYNDNLISSIPEEVWTDPLIKTILDKDGGHISLLPSSVVTKEWVLYALFKGSIYSIKIPAKLWDEDLAEVASDKTGLGYIPIALRTKSVCLKSIYTQNFGGIDNIPLDLQKDIEIQIAYVCKSNSYDYPIIKDKSFQLKALQTVISRMEDNTDKSDVESLLNHLKECVTDWVPIIKLWPEAIKLIEKPDQTPDMIMAALSSRTERDDLEKIAKCLNLTRVTKEMAPMLLCVEDTDVKDFVSRKFAPPKRAEEVMVNEILVDISPQELRDINKGGS